MSNNTTTNIKRGNLVSTRTITMTALLAAMSYVLAFLEFPVPLSPSFARMDLSDLPALIGAFAFGPMIGVMIELIKNILQLVSTSTGGIGELANSLMGASYVLTAGFIYKYKKTKKMAMWACVISSVVMGIAAAIVNYFILLPLFEIFMPLKQLIASFGELVPFIKTKLDVVLFNALPFNILKGLIIGAIAMLIYKKLTWILKGDCEMTKMDYLNILVNEIHSTTVATIGSDGHPQTRIIDMMYYDEEGVYFLTAKGKAFYDQLMEQQYVAISATKDKIAVSLRGKIKNIKKKNLDIMFEKNPYMKKIYPGDTKDAIEVFQLYEAQGEYFDISNPSNIVRDTITIGKAEVVQTGYYVGKECIGCKLCYSVCPQKCIDISSVPVSINQNHCLHCGRCAEICPRQCIEKRN